MVGSEIPPNNAEMAAGKPTFLPLTLLVFSVNHNAVKPGTVVPEKNQMLMVLLELFSYLQSHKLMQITVGMKMASVEEDQKKPR